MSTKRKEISLRLTWVCVKVVRKGQGIFVSAYFLTKKRRKEIMNRFMGALTDCFGGFNPKSKNSDSTGVEHNRSVGVGKSYWPK